MNSLYSAKFFLAYSFVLWFINMEKTIFVFDFQCKCIMVSITSVLSWRRASKDTLAVPPLGALITTSLFHNLLPRFKCKYGLKCLVHQVVKGHNTKDCGNNTTFLGSAFLCFGKSA